MDKLRCGVSNDVATTIVAAAAAVVVDAVMMMIMAMISSSIRSWNIGSRACDL